MQSIWKSVNLARGGPNDHLAKIQGSIYLDRARSDDKESIEYHEELDVFK